MKTVKVNVLIGRDRRVVFDVPGEVAEGPAEVLIVVPESSVRRRERRLAAHVARIMAQPRGRSVDEINAEIRAERECWD